MIDQRNYECAKCDKSFKLEYNLRRHLKRKTPCDKIFKCEKCNKIFKNNGSLNKHLRRKNPCEPILGNTQEPLKNPNTCHFCYREFKNKYTLRRHFNTCKIRNGNMPILFQKIKQDRKLIEELRKENKSIRNIITNNVNNVNNGNITNNIIQFNMGSFIEKSKKKGLINFGDLKMDELVQDVICDEEDQIGKIFAKQPNAYNKEEWGNRVGEVFKLIYRNPQYPQLQNVFTLGSQEKFLAKDAPPIQAFLWHKNMWNGVEWAKVREYLIKQIHEFLPSQRRDKLKVKSRIRKAYESLDVEVKTIEEKNKTNPKLLNKFFMEYEDSRTDTDFLWVFIAMSLDREGLLDMSEIQRIVKN